MSTAYGITGATCWVNAGTPQDSILQNANGTADFDVSNMTQNGGGGQLAAGGKISQLVDTFGGTLAQATSADQPLAMPFGAWGHGDGSQPTIKFHNYKTNGSAPTTPGNLSEQSSSGAASSSIFLNLPGSTLAFNGTTTGEMTVFVAGRFGYLQGGPFALGTTASGTFVALSVNQSNVTKPSLNVAVNDGTGVSYMKMPPAFVWPNMQPCVMCLRFASNLGVVAAKQRDLWIGTNYRMKWAGNNLVGDVSALAGGYIGSNGTDGPLDCEISEFLVYQNALTDAQCEQIIQTMQDKWCGGFSNNAFVLFFGDSRTRGNNAQLNRTQGNPSTFDSSARCWPKRCLSQLGGYAMGMNQARVGDQVADQYAQFATAFSSIAGDPNYSQIVATACGANVSGDETVGYTKVICIGEIGINDIYFNGQTAAQVEASLTTLYNAMVSTGTLGKVPVNVVAMTIVAPAIGNVFAGTTFTTAMNNTVTTVNQWIKNTAPTLFSGLIACDNAADPRWANAAYVGSDGLHPDDPGYGVYAQNAAKALTSALGLASAPTSVGLTFGNFPAGGKSLTYGSFR